MLAIAPTIAAVIASFIAGHPTQVVCDVPEAATAVDAWTTPNGSVIHVKPSVCEGLAQAPGTSRFALSLATLLHEGAHGRGVRAEKCAEAWADLATGDVLASYFGVPLFTATSRAVVAQVRASSVTAPPAYRPDPASCSIEPFGGPFEDAAALSLAADYQQASLDLDAALTRPWNGPH